MKYSSVSRKNKVSALIAGCVILAEKGVWGVDGVCGAEGRSGICL